MFEAYVEELAEFRANVIAILLTNSRKALLSCGECGVGLERRRNCFTGRGDPEGKVLH